jgi:MoxR-like ATPase
VIEELGQQFAAERYLADEGLLTAVHLSLSLRRPLILEGEPGVGKTELAKVLAKTAHPARELIRLQCYEGLDAAQALYEWDHPKQLLAIRACEAEGRPVGELYDESYLLERPLLRALRVPCVLLIDEIDRADSEFEAFLLEFLSDFQITIPELGTISAATPPIVVMTSNRTRELHDALKRRCLYHWIAFPDAARERAIIDARVPGLADDAAASLVAAVSEVRRLRLIKPPGIAETIDWAQAAKLLAGEGSAWPEALRRSLGLLLKEAEDTDEVLAHAEALGLA